MANNNNPNNRAKKQFTFSTRFKRHSARVWNCKDCLKFEIALKDSPIKIATSPKKKKIVLITPRRRLVDVFIEPLNQVDNDEEVDDFILSHEEQDYNEINDNYNRLINFDPDSTVSNLLIKIN